MALIFPELQTDSFEAAVRYACMEPTSNVDVPTIVERDEIHYYYIEGDSEPIKCNDFTAWFKTRQPGSTIRASRPSDYNPGEVVITLPAPG